MLTGTRVFIVLCFLSSLPTAIVQAGAPSITHLLDMTYPQQRVTDAHGASMELYGESSAMDGNTAVVGAPQGTINGVATGKAFVFVYNGTSWVQQAVLKAADGAADDHFGVSVAVNGNTVVVGASNHKVGAQTGEGVAYVFVRSGTTWSQQAELKEPTGVTNDDFGAGVAISKDTALIGCDLCQVGLNASQGKAYVFVRSGTTWSKQSVLIEPNGGFHDYWGTVVALQGNTAVLGGPLHTVNGHSNQGAAAVFVRSATHWSFQQELTAPDGVADDTFGSSVALSGTTLLIGSPHHTLFVTHQGSGYVFTRNGTGSNPWSFQAQLSPGSPVSGSDIGYSASISGNYALLGANSATVGANSLQGLAYAFVRSGTLWYQLGPAVTSFDGATDDFFGGSAAISGLHMLVGAFNKTIGLNGAQGAAYFFSPYRPDDLQVTASGPTFVVHTDDVVTLTASVMDHGNNESSVMLQIKLPAGVTYQSDLPSQGEYDRSTNSWYVGTLISGDTATLTIHAVVKPPVNNSQVLTFRASSKIPDINNSDNTATASFTVVKVQQLVNGGFENYSGNSRIPIDWNAHNFNLATDGKDQTAGNHVQGATSVRIANSTAITKTLQQELFGPTGSAGDAFTFSYWVKGMGVGTAGQCLGRVQFLLASSPVGAPKVLPCGLSGTFPFTQRTLLFKAPANFDDVIVTFVYSEPTGTIWLDGASLLR